MNDVARRPVRPTASALQLDPDNPWLGLSSYTEETRAFFHGREEEAAELARRVQRKLLTVLFGQSGLGKTSLLRAGLVPRLRDEGYCPVYVRVDYAPDSPSPAEQIKQAIFRATAEAGDWTQAGVAVHGESLWEFLHHRGDLLRDAQGRTVLPLLIFDQFEEVFTLAQVDDTGRARARKFLEELADLVENRPPAELEARIDRDEVDSGGFDFARADYRVLIALREDYVAHLESLKSVMPSITQNRMRLARMSGAQALSAVLQPGGRLVSREVAESIVRFVAGGAELVTAEVEPSLLSLVCRELNVVRQAQGRAEISADLLAGSRETILSEFYERALADQPAGVRRVVEDELLTESGYRESLAEERVLKALAAVGAAPDALATLVDRRLLRIEERLDVRRVELMHDVLCPVVRSSRDLRHEREARDEAERQLAAQRERAAETRRTLKRTRRFAVAAGVLSLVAIGSAVFGWVSWNRAKAADAQAQRARADAEELVAFLIEDFYEELQPTGRLETMGKLAHKAVGYYDGLPQGLMSPRTRMYRGMALVREGSALLARGDFQTANVKLDEASAIFGQLREGGDRGEPVAIGLALAKFTRYSSWGVRGAPGAKGEDLTNAIALLKPYVARPDASRQVRLLYADLLNYRSHQQLDRRLAVADCDEGRAVLQTLGARELEDLTAASIYADTSDSQARHSMGLGLVAEAEQLEREVYDIAEKVLVQRPGDFRSMSNRALAAAFLGDIARIRNDFDAYETYAARSFDSGELYVRLNPSDIGAWEHLIRGQAYLADADVERGRIAAGIAKWARALAYKDDPRRPGSLAPLLGEPAAQLALLQAEAGQDEAAAVTLKLRDEGTREALAAELPDNPVQVLWPAGMETITARVELLQGRVEAAYARATAALGRIRAMPPNQGSLGTVARTTVARLVLRAAAMAALRSGRYAEAEALTREMIALPVTGRRPEDPRNTVSAGRVQLAHAVVLQGRRQEARELIAPDVARYAEQRKEGAAGLTFSGDYTYALYVDALASDDASRRQQRLDEARRVLDALSAEARQLRSMRELERWIAEARATSS
ncbi:MAG TPA: hypothetical protein VNS57_07565 [Steroidobacteraceae bacterium]|nr:hypothetical protein [Steroidobacteraceae bacterium]